MIRRKHQYQNAARRKPGTGPQIEADLSRGKGMIIVCVTGSPDQILRDYACVIGAIAKPWSPQALEQVLLLVRA